MAVVVKSAKASPDVSTGLVAPQISGKRCGEDIPSAMMPCHIRADGKIYKASGAAADANARISGWSTRPSKINQALTLMGVGLVGRYSDGNLTPGNIYYLGAAGALDTVATVGDAVGCCEAIDAYNIRVTRNI